MLFVRIGARSFHATDLRAAAATVGPNPTELAAWAVGIFITENTN